MLRIFIAASLFAVALFGVAITGLVLHPEPPPANGKPLFQGAQIDEPTLALFQRACQNCHSENTRWPWYSRIPPASWMITKDVNDARSHVNFSNWGSYGPDEQKTFLSQIGVNVRTGRMPLPRYTLLHRGAILAPQERQQIYEWSRAAQKRLQNEGPPRSIRRWRSGLRWLLAAAARTSPSTTEAP
jgi:hypothetical protein